MPTKSEIELKSESLISNIEKQRKDIHNTDKYIYF